MTTGTALLDFAKRLDQTAEDTEALLSKLLSRELLPDEDAAETPDRAMRYSSSAAATPKGRFWWGEFTRCSALRATPAPAGGAALECITAIHWFMTMPRHNSD